jgi:hypothetical protein
MAPKSGKKTERDRRVSIERLRLQIANDHGIGHGQHRDALVIRRIQERNLAVGKRYHAGRNV